MKTKEQMEIAEGRRNARGAFGAPRIPAGYYFGGRDLAHSGTYRTVAKPLDGRPGCRVIADRATGARSL